MRRLNRYVEERAPWQLAKDDARADELDLVLALAARGPAQRGRAAVALPARQHRAAARRPGHAEPSLRVPAGTRGSSGAVSPIESLFPKDARTRPRGVIDSHTHLDLCERARRGARGAATAAGVEPHADGRASTAPPAAPRSPPPRTSPRSTPRSAAIRTRRGASTTPTSPSCARLPRTSAASRSARPASTSTARRAAAETRSARSPRRSRSRARPASRWSSTRAPPSEQTLAQLAAEADGRERGDALLLDARARCRSAWSGATRSPSRATSPTRAPRSSPRPPRACREEQLLVETDAPYLTPQAVRKQRNQPGLRGPHRGASSPSCAASPREQLERAPSSATRARAVRLGMSGRGRAGPRPAEPARHARSSPCARPRARPELPVDSNILGVIERAAELGAGRRGARDRRRPGRALRVSRRAGRARARRRGRRAPARGAARRDRSAPERRPCTGATR